MRDGKASRLPRPTGTSTSTQSPSSPVSRLSVTVKRPLSTSFSNTDSTLSVREAAPFKTAKVNDLQTTGKAKVAVTQSVTSRSTTPRLPTASHFSADLDRASRMGDKIKRRLATNAKASLTSVPPATSTITTETATGVSLQAPLTSAPLLVRVPPPAPPCLLPPPLLPPFPLCCWRMFTTCPQSLLLSPLTLLQMTTTGLHLSAKERRVGHVKLLRRRQTPHTRNNAPTLHPAPASPR